PYVGRLRRAVRARDRAHLDRRPRKYTGQQAAETDSLLRGALGNFGGSIHHATNLLDKSCEPTSTARPATGQRNAASLAMDHGLRLWDRQHDSWRNPGAVLQLGFPKLARDPAN